MHHDNRVSGDQKKPDTVLHCKDTKRRVDNLDLLAMVHHSLCKINKLLMALFFNMIDAVAIASFIIWLETFLLENHQKAPIGVVSSSENLAMNWSSHMLRESHRLPLSDQEKERVMELDLLPQQSSLEQLKYLPNANTAFCPYNTDRKVPHFCVTCNVPVCPEHNHKKVVCGDCV